MCCDRIYRQQHLVATVTVGIGQILFYANVFILILHAVLVKQMQGKVHSFHNLT